MLTTAQGLDITTDDPQVAAGVDKFAEELLGYGTGAGAILEAAKADPACVAANAWSAALNMFLESPEAPALARPYLAAARRDADRATPHERLLVAAIGAWVEGDIDRAIRAHDEIASRYPRDVIAMKLGQYHYFNRGDAEGLRDIAQRVLPANAENHYVHGMLAFGLEQCNDIAGAEREGRLATEMGRKDPWAHHAVAHVMETQGRIDEGIAWMTRLADTWEHCNSFMLTHNWWHVALFMIDRDDTAGALDLYDRRVWGAWKEYSQDQAGAVSLLTRLELRGVDVGDRWQDVALYLAQRTHDCVNGFLSLQYLYGLARAGEDAAAAELLQTMTDHAVTAPDRAVWEEVTLPAAHGLVAHARSRWSEAADQLGRALPRIRETGGSHAQRDLFELVWLDALVRAGDLELARQRWWGRYIARPHVPFLARTVRGLGMHA